MKQFHKLSMTTAAIGCAASILAGCGGSVSDASADAPVAAASKFFPVMREDAPGLPGYTVYRPADLSAVGGPVPMLLWANGACKTSNHQYWDVLGSIAARGFVVIAYGSASQMSVNETDEPTPSRMQTSLDWAVNQAKSKAGYQNVDTSKIGTFGTSCGGLEALIGGEDARVKSVAGLNTGFFDAGSASSASTGGYSVAEIQKLHTPLLFMGGGTSDIAYKQTHSNYDASKVPTVLVENAQGGHSGLWAGLRYTISPADNTVATASTVDYTITEESITAVVNWFDYTLNANAAAGSYFMGTGCGLCSVKGWTVQTKNF